MSSQPRNRAQPFLSLRNGAFRLGENLVFERTSWVFHRHEHWAIVGANGSGKSLFADALRGRLPLVQGDLRYHFQPPSGLSHEEAISQVSFEARKADVHETVVQSRWNSLEEEGAALVRDFLSYERVMEVNPFEVSDQHRKGRPQFERRMRRAVDLLRVSPLLDRTLLSLSNGERQRVQLARALSHPMRLLILDDPFVGLDGATRGQLHALLEQLMATRLRVLLIVTRLEDLPRHITHLLCVARCQVVAAGPRKRILALPRVRRLFAVGQAMIQRSADISVRSNVHREKPLRIPGRRRRSVRCCGQELVVMRNVTVRYGKNLILHKVNWTICAGESWALLGPNGSGKTTLLSLILGDNPHAYANEVAVFGWRRGSGESIWDIKRHIGWVSPELHLHFNDAATCFDGVASGFRDTVGLFKPATPRQRAAARRWLARFDLLESADRPLFSLSAGLQRMVLLARALVKKPRLLVLDEPCQGLDSSHRDLFVRAVDALIRPGTVTAIYVTHRPDEIPPSIKRVLRLRKPSGRSSEPGAA
jgi:molybdate transport system ATP-binding protein